MREKSYQYKIMINQVEKCFPKQPKPAVTEMSAVIRNGSVTGLVGPDGAGKTTLLRMLAGLLKTSSGTLRINGLDPFLQTHQLRDMLGYMPQKFGLYEDLTVLENLTLHADLRRIVNEDRKQSFEQLLTSTDLTHFTGRLAGKLSGGMKQKLGLACTLLGKPKVLLLDEPSVGVDPISRRELWQMVHDLANDGMLILWSTSYLEEAEMCENVLLMDRGKLLYSGAPHELTQRMDGRSFLLHAPGCSNRQLFQQAVSLPQVSDGALQGKYIRLTLKADATHTDLLNALAQPEAKIVAAQPRFEDAFIDLLGGSLGHNSELANIISPVPGRSDETIIEACQLTKRFGDFTATENINFQVKRGEIFGLLGPNGAGKSTTFKMMCGLLAPSSGKALVSGIDLKTDPGRARQGLGYMAQKFSLYGDLSVLQNLKFFSGVYGLSGKKQRDKINSMIIAFDFVSILNQTANFLPLGFKQRLALACALMHEPSILFLDEPTSGVDPLTRREFWLHINGMVNKGVTVMVTTHFMDEAEYCDRIGLVYRGEIIASGTPDELKHLVADMESPNPTMEQAFVKLVQGYDLREKHI